MDNPGWRKQPPIDWKKQTSGRSAGGEYDFTRDLGLKQENPNPRRLGYPASDTHVPLGGTLLEDHRIFWMTSACDDRYLVLSSKSSEQGQLFVWDTETHEFIHRIDPPLGATRPGPIIEALPGLLIGHTVSAEESPLLYGFDPASGDILWTKPVPSPPRPSSSCFSAIATIRTVETPLT